VTYVSAGGDDTRRAWLAGLTTLWGVRLGGYLLWRWRRNGPDRRYVNMMRHAPGNVHVFTLKKVFLLQGVLLWVVSLPLQLGERYPTPHGLTALGVLGVIVVGIGIACESLGDLQLTRFKADPANEGRVMDRGLWRYTRHPNYFGEFCVWWGFFLIALAAGGWWSAVSPLLMSVLLLKVSGVTLLEKDIEARRPDYREYVRRTNAFFPGTPRRAPRHEVRS